MNSSGWFLARVFHAVYSDGWSHMKVGCPRRHLHSPSGTSVWMPEQLEMAGWLSACAASPQHGGLEYSDFWHGIWLLPRASFPRAPDRLMGFLWLSFWNHIVSLLPCFTGYPGTAQIHMKGDYTRAGVSGVWFIVERGIFGDWVQCITRLQSRVLPH